MQDDHGYRISKAAIRLYRLGVPIFSLRQLERELWREMLDAFSVRRAAFRQAAEDVPWNAFVTANSEPLHADSCSTARGLSKGRLRRVLHFPLQLLEELLTQPSAEPGLQPMYTRAYLNFGKLASELGLHQKAMQAYQHTIERAVQMRQHRPNEAGPQALQRDALTGLGLVYVDVQRLEDAELAFQQALDIALKLRNEFPKDPSTLPAMEKNVRNQASLSAVAYTHRWESSDLYRLHEATHNRMGQQPDLQTLLSGRLAKPYPIYGIDSGQKWLHLALDVLQETCDAWKLMDEQALAIPVFNDKLLGALIGVEVLYHRSSLENRRRHCSQASNDRGHFGYFQYGMALSYEALELPDQAKTAYGKAISAFDKAVQTCPEMLEYRFALALTQRSLGRLAWRCDPLSYSWTNYPDSVCRARA